MTQDIFELQDVQFGYRGQMALCGVSLHVRSSERIALIGANGSGKSTLLRLLNGLCFAQQGTAKSFGEPLTEGRLQDGDVNSAFRRRVGLVFQNPDVQLFNPTVYDELAFGPLQLGWTKARVVSAIDEAMERFEISHLKGRAPHRLSGGEKKRVALASVMVIDPEVLLLDEPTAALDPHSRDLFIHLLENRIENTKTLITATHDLDAVTLIADRALVMSQGKIIADASAQAVLSDSSLLSRARLTHGHVHAHAARQPHEHQHIHMRGVELPRLRLAPPADAGGGRKAKPKLK